jgi:DNA-3-methyladenine glycosylase
VSRLERDYYERDTLEVAPDLLGCTLVHDGPDGVTSGRIVEVEAYQGEDDPACHAAAGLTGRTEPLYGRPGHAYIYLIYGMDYCLNAVTRAEGLPSAVLIRALEPLEGLDRMRSRRAARARRRTPVVDRDLANGPGKLCDALGLTLEHNRVDLTGDTLWIEAGTGPAEIAWSPRVGIKVGTDRVWRCFDAKSPYVSRSRFNREVVSEPSPVMS